MSSLDCYEAGCCREGSTGIYLMGLCTLYRWYIPGLRVLGVDGGILMDRTWEGCEWEEEVDMG